jgi:hypothetical protein
VRAEEEKELAKKNRKLFAVSADVLSAKGGDVEPPAFGFGGYVQTVT